MNRLHRMLMLALFALMACSLTGCLTMTVGDILTARELMTPQYILQAPNGMIAINVTSTYDQRMTSFKPRTRYLILTPNAINQMIYPPLSTQDGHYPIQCLRVRSDDDGASRIRVFPASFWADSAHDDQLEQVFDVKRARRYELNEEITVRLGGESIYVSFDDLRIVSERHPKWRRLWGVPLITTLVLIDVPLTGSAYAGVIVLSPALMLLEGLTNTKDRQGNNRERQEIKPCRSGAIPTRRAEFTARVTTRMHWDRIPPFDTSMNDQPC